MLMLKMRRTTNAHRPNLLVIATTLGGFAIVVSLSMDHPRKRQRPLNCVRETLAGA
jgi:hypothetical protein